MDAWNKGFNTKSMTDADVILQPLGVIRTPHQDPDRTPIQPCFAGAARGEVRLDPRFVEGLDGLAAFSHMFLIYHLHKAEPGSLRVKPFMLDEFKGVFACRYTEAIPLHSQCIVKERRS